MSAVGLQPWPFLFSFFRLYRQEHRREELPVLLSFTGPARNGSLLMTAKKRVCEHQAQGLL